MEAGAYGDYEIAGKMLEEHSAKGQQNSVEVFMVLFLLINLFNELKRYSVECELPCLYLNILNSS
jgi:hypothetical protein